MKLSRSLEVSIQNGSEFALSNNQQILTVDHLLWGSLNTPEVQGLLKACNISVIKLARDLQESIIAGQESVPREFIGIPTMVPSPALKELLDEGYEHASRQSSDTVSIWVVLLKILEMEESFAAYHLKKAGLNVQKVKQYASHGAPGVSPNGEYEGGSNSGALEENALKKYAVDLNERAQAQKIDPLIGREYEVLRTAQILSRRRKNNPLLVGEPGVGKTAIAEGLAKMIVDGNAPEALMGKTILSLNVGAMLAGTKFRGDFEQRIHQVLEEVKNNPDVILFIDEIHTLIGAGSSSGNNMDASNLIKPALASGDMRVIGATTFQEYREIFEKEKALDRRFQRVDVTEPSPEDTVQILKGLKKSFESHHNVTYTKDALRAAVDLSVKYLPDRFLPDKAIDLLDEAAAAQRTKPQKERAKFIDKTVIEETIAAITRLPIAQVSQDERDGLENLDQDLRNQVFGQEEAIETLSTAVCISKAGLNDDNKPLGSFLFAGPTGVGKTEIVRQLSKTMNIPLLRFDMSEYMEAHSVARLIGSPPGYVGHDKGGLLTDAVFKTPHSIVLLDEIEKAHPDIHNLLLQVMDRGALTDSNGRTVNFKNTYVVMTTNAGAQAAQKSSMGFVKSDHSSESTKVMNMTFAPEFRNRLDAIVKFKALGMEEIVKIVDKNIQALAAPLLNKNITLDVGDKVKEAFAKEGFDPLMGARPMARVIQDKLKKPLAKMMLFGDLKKGGTAKVDMGDNGELVWTTGAAAAIEKIVNEAQIAKPKKAAPRKKRETAIKI